MQRLDLIDSTRMRRYLLEKTQHIIGGFGKGIGEPPGKTGNRHYIESSSLDHGRHNARLPWSCRIGYHR
jgi:hypothetical protein